MADSLQGTMYGPGKERARVLGQLQQLALLLDKIRRSLLGLLSADPPYP